jgi:hypothetical protein
MAENQPNFNDTLPAAPSGKVNVKWQADAPDPNPSIPRKVSAYVPNMVGDLGSGGTSGAVPAPASGDATAGKFLKADGTWALPSGGGGGGGGFNSLLGFRRTSLFVADGVNAIPAAIGDVFTKVKSDNLTNTQTPPGSGFTPNISASTFAPNNFGDQAGVRGNYLYSFGSNVNANAIFALARTTNVDFWFVLGNSIGIQYSGQGFAHDGSFIVTPAVQFAAFRFSTSQGDTHYQAIVSDGSTPTTVDTGVAPTTSPVSLFIVFDDGGGTIKFYIGATLVATISSHLPASGQHMGVELSASEPSSFINPILFIAQIAVQADQ